MVRPLYTTLAQISPDLGSRCLALIDTNRTAWNAIIAEGEKAAAASAAERPRRTSVTASPAAVPAAVLADAAAKEEHEQDTS